MSAPVTTATLKSLLAAFNAHDLDTIMGYFAEDCVLLMPRGAEPEGRLGVPPPKRPRRILDTQLIKCPFG